MNMPLHLTLLALLLSASSLISAPDLLPSDTNLIIRVADSTTSLNWLSNSNTAPRFQTRETSALRGAKGFEVQFSRDNTTKIRSMTQKTKFMSDFWMRFYFRIDSCAFDSKKTPYEPRDTGWFWLSTMQLSESKQNAPQFLNLVINYKKGAYSLTGIGGETVKNIRVTAPISARTTYCTEIHVTFFGEDSFSAQLFLDGKDYGDFRTAYYYPREVLCLNVSNDISPSITWRVSADEFVISDTRSGPIPHNNFTLSENRIDQTLALTPDKTSYENEQIKEVSWQIFKSDNSRFPICFETLRDPRDFYQHKPPFPLDSGMYSWQLRHKNNFNCWGYWSKAETLIVTPDDSKQVQLTDIFFSEKGGSQPITQLIPEVWYDLHMKFSNQIPRDSLSYALAWFSNVNYPLGNPANKGGRFFEARNYIFNLSLFQKKFKVFHKIKENSDQATGKPEDQSKIYIDEGNTIVDTAQNEIKFRIRLLNAAEPGPWMLSGCLFYWETGKTGLSLKPVEKRSNILRKELPVAAGKSSYQKQANSGFLFYLFFAGLVVVIGFLIFKSKKPIQSMEKPLNSMDSEFKRIAEFINQNLTEKQSQKSITEALRLSQRQFARIMKRNGQTLPLLTNFLRIEQAKALLLKEESKTISEIAFSVGFQDLMHFFKTFRKLVGITPKEYRKQKHPTTD